MRKLAFDLKEYYSRPFCQKCKGPVTKKDQKRCEKAKFLLLCEKCYPQMIEAFKKCQPLMRKFSRP